MKYVVSDQEHIKKLSMINSVKTKLYLTPNFRSVRLF